jgi:hypothetical protein
MRKAEKRITTRLTVQRKSSHRPTTNFTVTAGGFFIFAALLCGVLSEIIRKRLRLP